MSRFKEDDLQIAVATYMRCQYPNVLWTHIANERKATPQHGARLKRKGVRAGMPDIMIFESKGDWAVGLAIELKIKPNKPTAEQIKVLDKLAVEGWQVYVCYSFDEAKHEIDNYLK